MIRRHNLKANYQVNVRNYKRVVEGLYDYNRKIWNNIKSKLTTDKWYVLIDMSMGIIYPCFYRMEQVTRYPLTEFSYDNLDLLTNIKKPCEQIIEMLGDLFIQLKPLLNKPLS